MFRLLFRDSATATLSPKDGTIATKVESSAELYTFVKLILHYWKKLVGGHAGETTVGPRHCHEALPTLRQVNGSGNAG